MIALSAGHYPASPGACLPGANYCEHGVATEWVHTIARYLEPFASCVIVPTSTLAVKVAWINTLQPLPALALEVHFNSDVSKAQHGSETLYCPRSIDGAMAADILQRAIAPIFSPSRGVKEGWYRMDKPGHIDFPGDVDGDESVDYFLKVTKCPALIVEPEFIYNRDVIDTKRDAACQAIAHALVEAVARLNS